MSSSSSSSDSERGRPGGFKLKSGKNKESTAVGGRGTVADTLAPELRQKVQDAFRVFDHENNNTVDVREIGTIIRSLGFCPSEAELQDLLHPGKGSLKKKHISRRNLRQKLKSNLKSPSRVLLPEEPPPQPNNGMQFLCPICNKIFASLTQLNKHQKFHMQK